MKIFSSGPGVYVSTAAHVALLTVALVSFSEKPRPMDAAEAIPVEMITDSQFNEVMKGVRDAPKPNPLPIVDKVSDVVETKPKPVSVEAKVDIATPPSPLKRIPDPGEDDEPTPPTSAAAPPPEPESIKAEPPKPEPPTPPVRPPEPRVEKPEPPKPEPKSEPKPEKAEAIEPPRPPVRPKPEPAKQAEAKPAPKPVPEPPPRVRTPPVEPKPAMKPDQIAALLADKKNEEAKPATRPKSGQESAEKSRAFDPNSISKLLSKEDPGQRASTGHTVNKVAALGAPNASAARMSPSLWGQLDGFLQEQYKLCWNYLPTGSAGTGYVPQIEVAYTQTGALSREPRLRNPPSDPAMRTLADSAIRAVKNPLCNPMRIPAQFQPFYNEWKERILRFDPDEMMR